MNDKHIILDPTGLYDIPSGYIRITTEVEWIQFFGVSANPCWVRGERLCKWAETWLRSWNRSEEITEIKQHPCYILGQLFGNVPLPHDWTDEQLLILTTKLDSYPQDNPIAHFLADNITNSNGQIWFAQASIGSNAILLDNPKKVRSLKIIFRYRVILFANKILAYTKIHLDEIFQKDW